MTWDVCSHQGVTAVQPYNSTCSTEVSVDNTAWSVDTVGDDVTGVEESESKMALPVARYLRVDGMMDASGVLEFG